MGERKTQAAGSELSDELGQPYDWSTRIGQDEGAGRLCDGGNAGDWVPHPKAKTGHAAQARERGDWVPGRGSGGLKASGSEAAALCRESRDSKSRESKDQRYGKHTWN